MTRYIFEAYKASEYDYDSGWSKSDRVLKYGLSEHSLVLAIADLMQEKRVEGGQWDSAIFDDTGACLLDEQYEHETSQAASFIAQAREIADKRYEELQKKEARERTQRDKQRLEEYKRLAAELEAKLQGTAE